MNPLMPIVRLLLVVVMLAGSAPSRADALQDGIDAAKRKEYATALRLLDPLAQAGHAAAQFHLGLLYFFGHGVTESNDRALLWFDRAARQGHADAQFQLGNMYAFGFAGPKHDADADRLAAQWYFEAARQNHADAQYSLGILFLTGTGVVQDSAEAQKWIERAAAAGHADAAAYVRERRK